MSNGLIPPTYSNTNKLIRGNDEYNWFFKNGTNYTKNFDNNIGSPVKFILNNKIRNINSNDTYYYIFNNTIMVQSGLVTKSDEFTDSYADVGSVILSDKKDNSYFYGLGSTTYNNYSTVTNLNTEGVLLVGNQFAILTGSAISAGSHFVINYPDEKNGNFYAAYPSRKNTKTFFPSEYSAWFLHTSGTNIQNYYTNNIYIRSGTTEIGIIGSFVSDNYINLYSDGTELGSIIPDTYYKLKIKTYDIGSTYNVGVYDSGTTPSIKYYKSGISNNNDEMIGPIFRTTSTGSHTGYLTNIYFDNIQIIPGSKYFENNVLSINYNISTLTSNDSNTYIGDVNNLICSNKI